MVMTYGIIILMTNIINGNDVVLMTIIINVLLRNDYQPMTTGGQQPMMP